MSHRLKFQITIKIQVSYFSKFTSVIYINAIIAETDMNVMYNIRFKKRFYLKIIVIFVHI